MSEFEKPMSANQKANGNRLYKFMMVHDVVTKEQMLEILGWDKSKDRQLRDLISLIAQKVPVISTSDRRGYKIAKTEADLREVEHQLMEFDSRIEEIEKRKKPLWAFRENVKFGKK